MKKSQMLNQKMLRDGTKLTLIKNENMSPQYQLNLVSGFITYQFPTIERLGEKRVRSIYDSVNSRADFQKILESYGRQVFLA